jgi:hypothetical protein
VAPIFVVQRLLKEIRKECIDGSCTCQKCPLGVCFGTRVL